MMVFFNVGGLPGPGGNSIYYPNCLLRNLCEGRAQLTSLGSHERRHHTPPAHRHSQHARVSDRRIARVEVFDDLTVAEPHWRALELVDSLATPYQRYDF